LAYGETRKVMHHMVKRITVIDRSKEKNEVTVVYRAKTAGKRKVSAWSRPFERAVRHLLRAQVRFGEEGLERQGKSNSRRRDGWIVDAPRNLVEASRKGFNEIRKVVPFNLLPKV
jgi:hypothetical protein